MNTPGFVIGAFSGFIAGCIFFGGLWLTVKRIPKSRHPAAMLLVSLVARIAIVLGAAAIPLQHGLPAVGIYVLGFLLARGLLIEACEPETTNTGAKP